MDLERRFSSHRTNLPTGTFVGSSRHSAKAIPTHYWKTTRNFRKSLDCKNPIHQLMLTLDRGGLHQFLRKGNVEVITPNILIAWHKDYYLTELHKKEKLADSVGKLLTFETVEEIMEKRNDMKHDHKIKIIPSMVVQRTTRDQRKRTRSGRTTLCNDKGKNGKKISSFTNKCKLNGHKCHEWEDCIHNPHSKNFKGEKRSLRSEKKDAADESSMKKKADNEHHFQYESDSDEDNWEIELSQSSSSESDSY